MKNHLWVSSNGYGFSLDVLGNGRTIFTYFEIRDPDKSVRVLKQVALPDTVLKEMLPAILEVKNSVETITSTVTAYCLKLEEHGEEKPFTPPVGVVYH